MVKQGFAGTDVQLPPGDAPALLSSCPSGGGGHHPGGVDHRLRCRDGVQGAVQRIRSVISTRNPVKPGVSGITARRLSPVTCQPSASKRLTMASPIPELAPVTTA